MKRTISHISLVAALMVLLGIGICIATDEDTYLPNPAEFLSAYDAEKAQAEEIKGLGAAATESGGEETQAYVPPSGREFEEITGEAEVSDVFDMEIFNTLVTLNFKDEDIQDVIRAISIKSGLNVIMSQEKVKGTITVNLDNVPLGVALECILRTNGLAMIKEEGSIVRVVPIKEVRGEKVVETKTIFVRLNWVTASDIAKIIEPFLTSAGSIAAARQSNALIITDAPPNLEEIQKLIDKMDVPEKQVMIEARLVDMSLDALRELGIRWNMFKKDESGASPQVGEYWKDDEGNYLTDDEGNLSPKFYPEDAIGSLFATGSAGTKGSLISFGRKIHFFGNDWNIGAQLNALEERDLIEVLASPRICTLNNMPAKIVIKQEIPYAETEKNELGIPVGVEIKFKEASIELEVTPYITNNGYVRMSLKPTHKIFRGRVIASTDKDASDVPIIDERSVETNVIVKDENTVALGGLKSLNRKSLNYRVPWLGNIPILGWLFKSKVNEDNKLELVLFVKPEIIKDPTLTAYEQTRYDQLENQWHLPDKYYENVDLGKYFDMKE